MKIGIGIGYSGDKMALPMEDIQLAERLGFDSVWTAETYGSDAITPLAYIGALTRKIRLATGIAQLAARPPANLTMCAQTIDAMAGAGRVIIGIGVSGPQIVEGWYGQPWGKPAARLRDYVAIMKKILRREGPVAHDGAEIALPYAGPGSSGLGKPLKSILHGNPAIPVLLGTSTPGNIRMAGEIADGWLSMNFVPGDMPRLSRLLDEGFAKRTDGMRREAFDVQGIVAVHVTGDPGAQFASMKPHIALYVGGMGAKDKNFHKDIMTERGYGDVANRVQELFLAGRKREAADAIPDEYVDNTALVGPPERIRQRWQAWAGSGLTGVTLLRPSTAVIELIGKIAL